MTSTDNPLNWPMSPWLIEFEGGPLDGQQIQVAPDRRGLPSLRILAARPEEPCLTSVIDEATPTRTLTLAYDRGEAMREDDHVWPYRFVGCY